MNPAQKKSGTLGSNQIALGYIHLYLLSKQRKLYGKKHIQKELEQRGYKGDILFPYVTSNFLMEEFDFPQEYWLFWEENAKLDLSFLGKLVEQLINHPKSWRNSFWYECFSNFYIELSKEVDG